MEEYRREYPRLSACGLNCGLCPRFFTEGASRCPGCGGAGFFEKRPSCGVLSCCRRRGVEYCYECGEYPCKKLEGAECVDSFITHRHMRKDFEAVRQGGLEAYRAGLDEKVEILRALLENYNDGRQKSFFCLAVNLLALEDVKTVMERIESEVDAAAPAKQKAALAVGLFNEMARQQSIELKLNKKPKP